MDACIEIEERADGFFTRWKSEFHTSDKWIGPYPTHEAAETAAAKALEQVMADLAKVMLGLN